MLVLRTRLSELVLRCMYRKATGDPRCVESFTYRLHYLGQEGRCPLPTRFDCCLGYALGTVAGAIVSFGFTGYMASIRNLHKPLDCWEACALPLVCLLQPSLPRPEKKRDLHVFIRTGGRKSTGKKTKEKNSQGDEEEEIRGHHSKVEEGEEGRGTEEEEREGVEKRKSFDEDRRPSHGVRQNQALAVPTVQPYRLESNSNLFRCYKRVKDSWKVCSLPLSP